MARMRQVKPQLRTSRTVAAWPFEVRYFWVLLWGYLDDEGRGIDSPKAIAGDCFPYDEAVTPKKVAGWLDRMARPAGSRPAPLCRYEVDGARYVHAVNWSEHQKPNRPTPSRLPPCPLHERLTEEPSDSDDGDSVSPALSPHEIPPLRGFEGLRESTRVREVDVPPSAGGTGPPTAQTLIAEWVEHCEKRPPGRVVGQVSRELKSLLDEGIDPADVRRGLAAWHQKSLHPSTLPSVVNEVMNGSPARASPPRPSTTDQRVAAALAAGARVQARIDQQNRLEITA